MTETSFPGRRKIFKNNENLDATFTGGTGTMGDSKKRSRGNGVANILLKAGKTSVRIEKDSKALKDNVKGKIENAKLRREDKLKEKEMENKLREEIAKGDEDAEEILEEYIENKKKNSFKKNNNLMNYHYLMNGVQTRQLEEGSLLLGCIADLLPNEIVFNLPFGLIGTCKKEHTIDYPDLTNYLSDKDLPQHDSWKLHEIYRIGEFYPVTVLSVAKTGNKFLSIQLSMRPSLVNAGLNKKEFTSLIGGDSYTEKSLGIKSKKKSPVYIPCSVIEEDEHVFKCGIGNLKNSSTNNNSGSTNNSSTNNTILTGILKKSSIKHSKPKIGQILPVCVTSIHKDSGLCELSASLVGNEEIGIGNIKSNVYQDDDNQEAQPTIQSLKPGMLLKGKVLKVMGKKIAQIQFCGSLRGILHSESAGTMDLTNKQLLNVRIIAIVNNKNYNNPNGGEGKNNDTLINTGLNAMPLTVFVTTKTHVTNLDNTYFTNATTNATVGDKTQTIVESIKARTGEIIDGCVTQIEDIGFKIQTHDKKIQAFCHYTKIYDPSAKKEDSAKKKDRESKDRESTTKKKDRESTTKKKDGEHANKEKDKTDDKKIDSEEVEKKKKTIEPGEVGDHITMGQRLKARILGYNYLDRVFNIGIAPSLLQEDTILSKNSLKLGQLLNTKITSVIPDRGVFVEISEYLSAEVPLEHLTNFPLKQVPTDSKFSVGKKLKVRVLQISPVLNKIKCTAKKDIVKASDSELLFDFSDAKIGQILKGYISGIEEYGVFVKFFGHLQGLVQLKDPERLSELKIGSLCKVRVNGIDMERKRLKLSFDLDVGMDGKIMTQNNTPGSMIDLSALKIVSKVEEGVVSGVVVSYLTNNNKTREAWIGKLHLSDNVDEALNLFNKLKIGKTMGECLSTNNDNITDNSTTRNGGIFLGIRCHKNPVTEIYVDVISLKNSLIIGHQEDKFVQSIDDVIPGKHYLGYVKQIESKVGVFVGIGNYSVIGLCPKHQCTEHFCVDPNDDYKVGQTIRVRAQKVENSKITFDMRLDQYRMAIGNVGKENMIKECEIMIKNLGYTKTVSSSKTTKGEKTTTQKAGEKTTTQTILLTKPQYSQYSNEAGGYEFFTPGKIVNVVVTKSEDIGVTLELSDQKEKSDDEKSNNSLIKAVKLFAMAHQVDNSEKMPKVGEKFKAFVFAYNKNGTVDCSIRTELVKQAEKGLKSHEKDDKKVDKKSLLVADSIVDAEVQISKMDYVIYTTKNSKSGKIDVIYCPNTETWNKLETMSVAMQRGAFKMTKIVLEYISITGEYVGRKPEIPSEELSKKRDLKEMDYNIDYNADGSVKKDPNSLPTSSLDSISNLSGEDLSIGQELTMRVISIKPTEVLLNCPQNIWGHLHATDLVIPSHGTDLEIMSTCKSTTPLLRRLFTEKQLIKVRIEKITKEKDQKWNVQVSFNIDRSDQFVDKKKKKRKVDNVEESFSKQQQATLEWSSLKIGEQYKAVVASVAKDVLTVELNHGIKGRLNVLDCNLDCNLSKSKEDDEKDEEDNIEDLERPLPALFDHFTAGDLLPNVFVLHVNDGKKKKHLDLSMIPPTNKEMMKIMTPNNSTPIPGIVSEMQKNKNSGLCINVKLPLGRWGQIHTCDIMIEEFGKKEFGNNIGKDNKRKDSSKKKENILSKISKNQHLEVYVLGEFPKASTTSNNNIISKVISKVTNLKDDSIMVNGSELPPLRLSICKPEMLKEREKMIEKNILSNDKKETILSKNMILPVVCYVTAPTNKGLFVGITNKISGRIQFRNLPPLPDGKKYNEELMKEIYPIGTILRNLIVLSTGNEKSQNLELSFPEGQKVINGGDDVSNKADGNNKRNNSGTDDGRKKGRPNLAEQYEIGQVLSGTIASKKEFGLFIRLDDDERVSCLCHVSEIQDDPATLGKDGKVKQSLLKKQKKKTSEQIQKERIRILEGFDVGQRITKVKVLKIEGTFEEKNQKMSLGMKKSYFTDNEDDEIFVNDKEKDEKEIEEMLKKAKAKEEISDEEEEEISDEEEEEISDTNEEEISDEEEIDMEEEEVDMEEEDETEIPGSEDQEEEISDEEEEQISDTDEDEIPKPAKKRKIEIDPEALVEKFENEKNDNEKKFLANKIEETINDNKTSDKKKSISTKKSINTITTEEEKLISKREEEIGNGPESPDDFERMLLSEGKKSSALWIKYMAFYLQTNEVSQARKVVERAITEISITEDQEKLNMWIAYLNLEVAFGSQDHVKGVFNRAVQYNDAKKIYVRMADIYRDNGKIELCKEHHQLCMKKFPKSKKMYINYMRFLFSESHKEVTNFMSGGSKTGQIPNGSKIGTTKATLLIEEALQEVLPRALRVLEKRKHIAVITKTALFEFEFGCLERGKTLFRETMSANKKRTDLWNVYLDGLIKWSEKRSVEKSKSESSITTIRSEFEDCIEILIATFGVKKALRVKPFFKKWLDYEVKHGDVEGQEKCKARAKAYVEGEV